MIEKVKTKEELLESLKIYKEILNNETIDYLNSLVGLEFSALRAYISNSERNVLSNIDIYGHIVTYNIYHRAINILSKNKSVVLVGNKENSENLNAYYNGHNVYCFKYKNLKVNELDKIGSINLFNTVFSEAEREKEITRIIRKLEFLYSENNPFNPSTYQSFTWTFTHQNYIKKYEDLLEEVDRKKVLTEDDKRLIEITGLINNEFLSDYQIKTTDFDEVIDMTKSELEKEYIKKLPDINVKNNIKYI